jgi:hypothetical protein
MKKIRITENKIKQIVNESIKKILMESYNDDKVNIVISYIKSFGEKGKLPSCDGNFRTYYEPYLKQAYEWASEKINEIRVSGFAYFKHLFGVNVINKITLNKRGLIYVERAIILDLDEDLNLLNYSSIGECWSWKKMNSVPYCANDRFNLQDKRNRVAVTICGYVHPDSIDWLETLYLNSYDMKNETEIRMNNQAYVEVAYIKLWGQKYRLGGTYLINAKVDKYNKNKQDW